MAVESGSHLWRNAVSATIRIYFFVFVPIGTVQHIPPSHILCILYIFYVHATMHYQVLLFFSSFLKSCLLSIIQLCVHALQQ